MYVLKLQDRREGWFETSRPVTLGQAWKAYRQWLSNPSPDRPRGIIIVRVTNHRCGVASGVNVFENAEV